MFFEDLNEEIFLDILDEFSYKLKVSDNRTEMMKDFEIKLKEYLHKWKLDLDQHNFVVLSQDSKKDK